MALPPIPPKSPGWRPRARAAFDLTFSQLCLAECAAVFLEMARILQRFLPNSTAGFTGTPLRGRRWVYVMDKDSNGTFGIIIGALVAVIAAIFIFTGGELGGKKTIQGDEDLPPIATTDK